MDIRKHQNWTSGQGNVTSVTKYTTPTEILLLYNARFIFQHKAHLINYTSTSTRENLNHPVSGLRPSSVITVREDHIENHTTKLLNLTFDIQYSEIFIYSIQWKYSVQLYIQYSENTRYNYIFNTVKILDTTIYSIQWKYSIQLYIQYSEKDNSCRMQKRKEQTNEVKLD